MKLALVIPSLAGGGAERVMVTLANAWAARGDQVTLITLCGAKSDVYAASPSIDRIALNVARPSLHIGDAVLQNLRRLAAVRRAIRGVRPDVVVSFMPTTNVLSILATRGTGIPSIISERVSIEDNRPHGFRWLVCRLAYRRAAAVVAQTDRAAAGIQRLIGVPAHVIANPVWISGAQEGGTAAGSLPGIDFGKRIVLAAGRLEAQKGFDLLIDAFARTADAHFDWVLLILGEGTERPRLEAQIAGLGLSARVFLPGFVSNPHSIMKKSDIFVLSSRFEGMPNALLEAMASGLPCVSFDCPNGPAEIIRDGIDGILVPREKINGLAKAIIRLMQVPELRQRLGAAARESIKRFNVDAVLGDWDTLFRSIFDQPAGRQDRNDESHLPFTARGAG